MVVPWLPLWSCTYLCYSSIEYLVCCTSITACTPYPTHPTHSFILIPILRKRWPSQRVDTNETEDDVEMSKAIKSTKIEEDEEEFVTHTSVPSLGARYQAAVRAASTRSTPAGIGSSMKGSFKHHFHAMGAKGSFKQSIKEAFDINATPEETLNYEFIPEEIQEAKADDMAQYSIDQRDAIWAFRYLLVYQVLQTDDEEACALGATLPHPPSTHTHRLLLSHLPMVLMTLPMQQVHLWQFITPTIMVFTTATRQTMPSGSWSLLASSWRSACMWCFVCIFVLCGTRESPPPSLSQQFVWVQGCAHGGDKHV